MKKYFVIISMLFILVTPSITWAATATPSASPKTASPSSKLNPLSEKIEELKKEIASKAAELKNEVTKKLQNKIAAGVLSVKTDSQLTVTGLDNKPLTVIINEYTEYQDQTKPKTPLTLKALTADKDYIVALGDVDDKDHLTAKKIVKVAPPKIDNKKVVWGQIVSANSSTIVLKGKDNQKITVSATGNTVYMLGKNEASFADVKPNKYLVASGDGTSDTAVTARYIFLIPTVGYTNPEKVKEASKPAVAASSSPSASPTKKTP